MVCFWKLIKQPLVFLLIGKMNHYGNNGIDNGGGYQLHLYTQEFTTLVAKIHLPTFPTLSGEERQPVKPRQDDFHRQTVRSTSRWSFREVSSSLFIVRETFLLHPIIA